MSAAVETALPSEVGNWLGRQLFDQVPTGIAVIDREFKVVVANEKFEEVFGEPVGQHCYEICKHRDAVCEGCVVRSTLRDGRARISDEEGFDAQGRRASYVVHFAPVFDEVGSIAHVVMMSYDLTETRSLQREYNTFFERVPCNVAVINRDLRVVRSNALLRETFGDTIGEHCYEVYKHRSERCPDCPAEKTFADGESYRSEQVGIDRLGNPNHYVVTTTPASRSGKDLSHVIEMSVDVTNLHEVSAELNKEMSFRHILIENTLDALVAVNGEGIVNIFNRAAEALFKIGADQVVGIAPGERFLPPDFLRSIQASEDHLALAETSVLDQNGERLPVRFSGSTLRDEGGRIGAAAFFQDLREVKRLEREKLESERLAAVGQTVAQLAHGIKNILTGLRGGMYGIKSGIESGSEQRLTKGWEMLDRNVDRMTVLVRGFLDYSKAHVARTALIDPTAIANEVYELYRDTARNANVELRLEAHGDPAPAPMEAASIHSCLSNLVTNAVDATAGRTDGAGEIAITVGEEDDAVVFEVRDNGCGMPPEIKERVFTSFFTTKGLAGTGLGLLVTRKLVEEHGGEISVESEPDVGSSFRLVFPRRRLPATEQGEPNG